MKELIKQKVSECDLLLIGIGEEFEVIEKLNADEDYLNILAQVAEKESIQWIIPYINFLFIQKYGYLDNALKNLQTLVKGKNYYIVTTCMNGVLEQLFDDKKVVSPCGNFYKMQGKEQSIITTPELILREIENFVNKTITLETLVEKLEKENKVFNNLYATHYDEAGYLDNWNIYTKWLQGTLNKKVCILELGVGLKYPSVIRWPFEKIGYLNNKAEFFRIHETLYQLSEELHDKGHYLAENSVYFLEKYC